MPRAWTVAAALVACAPRGHWPPRPAENPPTPKELAYYEVTVRAPTPDERAAFADALAARGFTVVDHDPYKGQLDVFLTHEPDAVVATLRSDGWFVDEAVGPDLATLVETLAVSQRVTDFIRNSGLPQQKNIPNR
jgi:hypothetical protein